MACYPPSRKKTAIQVSDAGPRTWCKAQSLAEAGAAIVVHYVNDAGGAAATVDAVNAAGRDAIALQADLSRPDEVADLFAKIDESAPVDCVVNNAGSYPVQEFTAMSAGDWQAVMAANLDTAVYVSQEAIRRMCSGGSGGSIVNIASIEGTDPALGHAHYAAAKAAVLMLTRSCSLEYGRQGIRVNAVSPGISTVPAKSPGAAFMCLVAI